MLGIIMAIITTIILIKIHLKNIDKKIDNIFIIETIKKYFFIIISYVILTTLIFSIFYNNPYFKNIIENSSSKIYDIIILIMLSMSTSLFILGFGSIPIKYLKDKIYVKKIEKTYEVKDIEYYRNIIKNVSPAILSFCYKNRISFSDELVALLLHVQMRKIINIKDNKIIFIGDVNLLTESEKFAIRHIKKFNFKNLISLINKFSKEKDKLYSFWKQDNIFLLEKYNWGYPKLSIPKLEEEFFNISI